MSDAVVSLALLLAYLILTLTGNDGTAVLGLLGGYLARAGVQSGIDANARGPG
jgi:hypothetical protein